LRLSQSYKGKIIKVIDGDTYLFQTANGTLKVKAFGIDAPESIGQMTTKRYYLFIFFLARGNAAR
jgi:endonuclease YncB( thermonuclease family)